MYHKTYIFYISFPKSPATLRGNAAIPLRLSLMAGEAHHDILAKVNAQLERLDNGGRSGCPLHTRFRPSQFVASRSTGLGMILLP